MRKKNSREPDKNNFVDDNSMKFILKSRPLSEKEFQKISTMIYDLTGINLHVGKKELVQARLNKRLRQLGLETYKEYFNYLDSDGSGAELTNMIDVLSTNLTYFFREPDHFDYLRDEVLSKISPAKTGTLRVWSAGCSSGEEAYTLAMVIREALPDVDKMDALILATDISTRVLETARRGEYAEIRFKDTVPLLRQKYFSHIGTSGDQKIFKSNQDLNRLIRFRHLNLKEQWPMQGMFDVVFCRNVMIYFDKQTQGQLINRFYNVIKPGGIFIVGHSESLTGVDHKFKYVRPTIYLKN